MDYEKVEARSFSNLSMLLLELNEIFNSIGKLIDCPGEYYDKVAQLCAKRVRAESCSIWICDRPTNRLYLTGGYGYNKLHKDQKNIKDFYYDQDSKGVTRQVFDTGQPNRAKNKTEVNNAPCHDGRLYKKLHGIKKDKCHSWYQFPFKWLDAKGKDLKIGVMKVENQLDSEKKILLDDAFPKEAQEILKLLANTIVPAIYWLVELKAMNEQSKKYGPMAALHFTPDIDTIFSKDVLELIKAIKRPRDNDLHKCIKKFIGHVERERSAYQCEYYNLTHNHVKEIADCLSFNEKITKYLEPLNDFQEILFQLPNYREHFIHQFNVFLIGYLILNTINKQQFKHFTDCLHNDKNVFQAWFLTSLMHDTGYPLGKAGHWSKKFLHKMFDLKDSQAEQQTLNINELLASQLLQHGAIDWLLFIIDEIKRIFNLQENDVDELKQIALNQFLTHLDEDIIAALLLVKAGKDTKLDDTIVSISATAIAIHSEPLQKFLKKIFFSMHPLAFLLCYCDNIQEQGRFRIERKIGDDWRVRKTSIRVDNNCVKATLIYTKKPGKWDDDIFKKIKNLENIYKGPVDTEYSIYYEFEDGSKMDNVIFEMTNRLPSKQKKEI